MNKKQKKEFREKFVKRDGIFMDTNNKEYVMAEVSEMLDFITKLLREDKIKIKKPKVGFLRQWINEDVKCNSHRLITNKDIEKFLDL